MKKVKKNQFTSPVHRSRKGLEEINKARDIIRDIDFTIIYDCNIRKKLQNVLWFFGRQAQNDM